MRNIPLWHWAAATVAGSWRRDAAETMPVLTSFPSPEKPASSGDANTGRDQIAASYRAKIDQLQRQSELAKSRRGTCYSYLIASLFVLAALFFISLKSHLLPAWLLVIPTIAALAAFEKSRRHDRLIRESGCLLEMYRDRLQRVEHAWMGKGDPGLDLQRAGHLSARDLDLFGEGSLFELLCDVQTPAGRETLARWLQIADSTGRGAVAPAGYPFACRPNRSSRADGAAAWRPGK